MDQQRQFRAVMQSYFSAGKIKECFHHDQSACVAPIKQSHSLQRNGRLSIIEGDVKGNQSVYSFSSFNSSSERHMEDLKPLGKGEASTFFGFCDYHDTHLFSPIENYAFDGSDFHCFLHSYRSFAHSYHKKKEQLKVIHDPSSLYYQTIPVYERIQMQLGTEMAMKDIEPFKKYLDKSIDEKDYSSLEYFTYVKPGLFPFAVSSIISPKYSYTGKAMNNHTDSCVPFSQIMLTVLPDKTETIIILAAFPEDEKAVALLDELDALQDEKIEKAITSLIINNCENTFFAPAVWNSLTAKEKRKLLDEVDSQGEPTAFVHSAFNFFDDRFEATRLGIVPK